MAAHRRPGETRRSLRRQLPADRLRPLEPGQRGDPPDRGADPVQEPQPRPPHFQHLAALDAVRELRRAGAGADAPRPPLVLRLGRRDLPEPEPDPRREAGCDLRLRLGSRLPDRPAADDRAAPRGGCRDHRRGPAGADRAGARLRRDRRRRGRPHDRGVHRETGALGRDRRTPPTRCSRRWATTSSTPRC